MRHRFGHLFLFIVFSIFVTKINAFEILKVDERTQKVALSKYCELFVDEQNHFSYEDVSKDLFSDNFKFIKSEPVYTGYADNTLWIRFGISNESADVFNGKVEIPLSSANEIHYYIQKDKTSTSAALDLPNLMKSEDIGAKTFFIPLSIEASQSATIYIKIRSYGAFTLAPQLYSQKKATKRMIYTIMISGILIGVVIAMFFYSISGYLKLKDKNYLLFLIYLIGLFCFGGSYYGYGTEVFLQNSLAVSAFTVFAGVLFSKSFLNIDETYPKSRLYFFTILIISVLLFVLNFIAGEGRVLFYINSIFLFISFLFLALASLFLARRKISGAIHLTLAWLSLCSAVFIVSMINFGFIDYCGCLYDLYAFVIIFNIIMISSAFTSRIEDIEIDYEFKINKEHEAVEKLKISNNEQIKQNEKLERKIQSQESELLAKNIESKDASAKDNMSGLFGRAKLEKILTNELHRAKRYHYKFSIIVINIDDMGAINAKHGEQVGDSVIKEMTELFMKNIRFLDAIGYWDKNEYIVICPETDVEHAVIAAQHLQKLMEKNKFFFIGSATASFGVTDYHAEDTIQDIVKRGYEALMRAKEGGKNRVEML